MSSVLVLMDVYVLLQGTCLLSSYWNAFGVFKRTLKKKKKTMQIVFGKSAQKDISSVTSWLWFGLFSSLYQLLPLSFQASVSHFHNIVWPLWWKVRDTVINYKKLV